MNDGPIDFVVLWVDGDDPEWIAERGHYLGSDSINDLAERYRSMDTFRYWFRGVEEFCPWVRTIHFVTWGHTPAWLNRDAPKLHIVNHRDFFPSEYLPTYNSGALEINIHRIPGLSEHFVSFNDDMYVISKMRPEDFFLNGLPVDMLALQPIIANPKNPIMSHRFLNNSLLLSRHFTKRGVAQKRPSSFFHVGYPPLYFFYNAMEMLYPQITGFYSIHQPAPLLRSMMVHVWELEAEALYTTTANRFRDDSDVNVYVFREWQKLSGNFVPRNVLKRFAYYEMSDDLNTIVHCIKHQKKKIICINDSPCCDFDSRVRHMVEAFDAILPHKSSFEVD
jgi:hypothetical protein